MTPRRLLIDTDPGVDDAIALFMALASPELDVVGVTTVFGNAETDITTRNALVLLDVADRPDIPVAPGAAEPIASEYLGPVPHVHGANALGDASFLAPSTEPVSKTAAELIHETAVAAPGEVTLLALGPLTNLATALRQYPELVELVHEVVLMGGNALVPGNATPVAEANINNDPEAADIVFGADWSVIMVGLDVTHQVNLTGAVIDRIARVEAPTARLIGQAIPKYRHFFEATNGTDGIYVHDPSAVAYLIDPGAFGIEHWPIRVETESISRGKTWPSLGNTDEAAPPPWRGRPQVGVCTTVDSRRVVALVEDRLSGPR